MMIIHLDIHDHSDIPIQLTDNDFKELIRFLKSSKDKSIAYIKDNKWQILHIESSVDREDEGCNVTQDELKPMGLDAFG